MDQQGIFNSELGIHTHKLRLIKKYLLRCKISLCRRRIRPRKLSELIGQKHLVGKNGILKKAIKRNN